jgi:GAF domain-containing protein
MLARQAAIAIENARLYAQVKTAYHDVKTLNEQLQHTIPRLEQQQAEFCTGRTSETHQRGTGVTLNI